VSYPWDTAYNRTGPVTCVGGDSSGDVHELDVGLDDNGNALDFQYKTQLIDCGSPDRWKRFLGLKLKLAAYDATLTIDIYADGNTNAAASKTVAVSSSNMFSEISGGYTEVVVNIDVVARFICIRVRNNNVAENLRLYGFTIQYVLREFIR
jgi:hypothetical protein